MANEIRVSASLQITNGNFSDSISLSNKQFDQANPGGGNPGTIEIGTTEESVSFTQLGTEGWLFMQNLDTTNYVRIGFATGVYGIRLEPGEFSLFRLEPSATLYLIADTAACKVNIRCFED